MSDIVSPAGQTIVKDDCRPPRHDHYGHGRCDRDDTLHLMAGHERLLKAIGDVGERAADRAVLFVKALGDSEGRVTSAISQGTLTILKDANDNAVRVIKEINDNQKALDNKLAIIQMKVCDSEKETIKTNFENTIRLLERIGDVCGPRRYESCGHGSVVVK